MVVRVQRDGAERRLTVEEFESEVTRGTIPEELPVSVDGRWIRAADWPTWGSLRASTSAQLHDLWRGRQVPWVTAFVVGLIVQIQLFAPAYAWLTRDTTGILERGEGWRLVTYALLHAGPDHLLSNAAGLAVACWGLERLIGRVATGVVLLASIVTGGVASALLLPQIQSLGISGGDFGVLGACAMLSLRFLEFVPPGSRAAFGMGAALLTAQFLWGGVGVENVDTPAHFGGLAAGLVLGLAYRPNVAAWARWNRGVTIAAALLVTTAVLAPPAVGVQLIPLTAYEADGARAERPAWWTLQVGRGGLGGYGNADRTSSVALETSRQAGVQTTEVALSDVLARTKRLDPAATLEVGPEGRGTVKYTSEGTPRTLYLRLVVRGLYVTVAGVDVEAESRMAPRLQREVLDELELATPTDLVDVLAGASSSSPRVRLAAAVAAAELGAPDRSAAVFAAERARSDPGKVDTAQFTVLAALGASDAKSHVEAAVVAWPEDRRLHAAAARAMHTLGDTQRAGEIATALFRSAEGERAVRSAEALLAEVGAGSPSSAAVPE